MSLKHLLCGLLLAICSCANQKQTGLMLPRLGGGESSVEELSGAVTVLAFFSTWCPTCRFELRSLEKLREHFAPQGLRVVGILIDDKPERGEALRRELALRFPVLVDREGAARKKYAIVMLPKAIVTGCDGRFSKALGSDTDSESFDWNSREAFALLDGLISKKLCS